MSDHNNYTNPYGAAPTGQAYAQSYGQNYYPAAPVAPVTPPGTGLAAWFNFTQPAYLKGFLLGAGAALVLTNPTVQKALVGGAVRLWSAVHGGVEELKEQIEDAKAEISREG